MFHPVVYFIITVSLFFLVQRGLYLVNKCLGIGFVWFTSKELTSKCLYIHSIMCFSSVFSMLLASSSPEVIKISSVLDITSKVEEYYNKGYVVGAIHPILLPIGHRRNFPASHMYRVVLSRLKLR